MMALNQTTRSLLPVVALVGRPNVGKSTLFNCLTASRAALISDYPGLTRDRQYGESHFADHHFIVIDTGGLAENNDPLQTLTTQQSLQAVEEAHTIVFVVDGRNGLTADDHHIASQLRKLNKKIVLAVNKTEHMEATHLLADFYGLGFGTPLAIAAAHHQGITALVEMLFEDSTMEPAAFDDSAKGIQLALIGRPNVGKSTLLNRMLGEERVVVYDHPGTTRDSIFVPFERFGKPYTLIDTAGIRQRGKIIEAVEKFSVVKTIQAISAADVILFVIDAREGVTDQDLKLLGFILNEGKSLVIAVNKWDGLSPDARDHARATLDRRLNFLPVVRIHFISALHGTGVGNLFKSVEEAYESSHRECSTAELTRILGDAVARHSPPLVKGRRIKLRYAHLGGHAPPVIVIHGNQLPALPDSYKRYLAHVFQERLHLVGTVVLIQLKNSQNPFRPKKR